MKLIVENGALSPGSVFKLVAIGWFVGVGALFVLVLIPMLIVGSIALVSDNAPTVQWPDLLTIIMIPIVLAGQAIMFGAIGALGYVVFRRYRSVNLEIKSDIGVHSSGRGTCPVKVDVAD